MAKDTFYFTHDFNARNDERILLLREKYGMEGVGMFWSLIEVMCETTDRQIPLAKTGVIAKNLWIDAEKLDEFISYCCSKEVKLFRASKNFFWSESLRKRLETKDIVRKKARDSANARWGANAMRTHNEDDADAMLSRVVEVGEEGKVGEGVSALAPFSFQDLENAVAFHAKNPNFKSLFPSEKSINEVAINFSYLLRGNGYKTAKGKTITDLQAYAYMLLKKELEFSK